MPNPTRPANTWNPTYFLAALGAGGLVVTFFLWLYMWIPHPGQQVPVFEDIAAAFAAGGLVTKAMIALAALSIAGLAVLHYQKLIWNIAQYQAFKRTEAYQKLLAGNQQSALLGLPLALAMAINVGFILGMVFVPGLWSVVEYLFPAAILAFVAVGVLAFRMIGAMIGRYSTKGGFNWEANGSFAQVQPAFALAMVGVGLSAPAALSTVPLTSGIALMLSTVFLVTAVIYALIGVTMGIAAMLQHGAAVEGIPTLMNIVPLTTVLGILILRQNHGLHEHFGVHSAPGDDLRLLTVFLVIQMMFGLFGLTVMKKHRYMERFYHGNEYSSGSYGLICPGVAVSVMMMFWVNKGLVGAGLIAKFGLAYWALSGIAVAFQVWMILLLIGLNRRHFTTPRAAAVPAE
ncbi:hypothetical protein E7811_06305 [Aliigemmobacter aestuarii]|uniref:Uncharacterized protein n=1 Tax=Aliigemmobacter aestuarii TaxID=1445661 RepID=A0A4S3MRZ5_9RHOB|nr:hypothetical protein [Gemmobacter aestuarii]THD85309.1 hypothetical protein E7811_06305 [Gemmobacter aestuarii]